MMLDACKGFQDAGWRADERIGGRPTDRCVRPAAHRRHAARGAPAHRSGRLRRLLIKLESANPTGSMKDRMALAMIEAAERSGRLKPRGRVVEYTGGSTGVSLAFVCAARGYSLSLVTSDAFSIEKRRHMAALGAELTIASRAPAAAWTPH